LTIIWPHSRILHIIYQQREFKVILKYKNTYENSKHHHSSLYSMYIDTTIIYYNVINGLLVSHLWTNLHKLCETMTIANRLSVIQGRTEYTRCNIHNTLDAELIVMTYPIVSSVLHILSATERSDVVRNTHDKHDVFVLLLVWRDEQYVRYCQVC
jgi:hypothetical protein